MIARFINARPWRCWFLFLGLVLAAFLPSLGNWPIFVWQDEVQTVDFGRVVLDPHTDWAVSWSTFDHKPLFPISYLGCVGAEAAYRITGTVLGSRMFCIGGGFLLGTLVFALLRQAGRSAAMALLFAGLVVLDPGLVQSFRAGRLDAMAVAFVLAGAVCLQRHLLTQSKGWLIAAAFALACSPYIWARAAMAVPAAVLPLIFAVTLPDRKLLRTLLLLVVLTAAAALLLLPPAWQGIRDAHALAYSPVQLLSGISDSRYLNTPVQVLLRMFEDILRCCGLSVPLLLLAAIGLVAAFTSRHQSLLRKALAAIVVLATLFLQYKTTSLLHHFTALYLVPLFLLLSSHALEKLPPGRFMRWLSTGMALLLTWHGFSTISHTYDAWQERGSFGPEALLPAVKALPAEPRRLIVDDFRLYFLLRNRGFQTFYLFTDMDRAKESFRFYIPLASSSYQPFHLFNQMDKATREETFNPRAVPGLLVGGSTPMWATYFEAQLRKPVVKQLPLGYRQVPPPALASGAR